MSNPLGLPFDEPEPVLDTTPEAPTPPAARGRGNPSPPVEPAVSEPPSPRPLVRRAVTVTELTLAIRDHLESEFFEVWVEGELSNCKVWNNGHLYFTLKDDRSQLKGFMFKSQLRYVRFKPVDGLHVVARGRVSVYEPKGEYQLTCEHLEPKGLGALQLAYEQLKKRLQAEGMFDDSRKRPLPALPRTIGIVTSLDGAAIRDMLKVLARRHRTARVVIRSTRVQGEGAAGDIARAIRFIARVPNVDVVIVGRGGGSIEDLWAFNEEVVARAIADCPVPVISAVGHETDVTIADFAADRRAPTPSAAAEIVVAAKDELGHRVERTRRRLDAAVTARIQSLSRRVHVLSGRPAFAGFPAHLALRGRDLAELTHQLHGRMRLRLSLLERRLAASRRDLDTLDLGRRLAGIHTRLSTADSRVRTAMLRGLDRLSGRLRTSVGRLESLSPLAVLGRGYAVAWNAERTRALRRADEVAPGERIRVTLARGELECDVRRNE